MRAMFVLLCGVLVATGRALAFEACGSLDNHFGPWDYINPEHRTVQGGFNLEIVEKHHFTQQVESLKAAETSTVAGDIGYTLRVWPNHHRALLAITRLALKLKSERPQGISMSIDCWFVRAKRMSPSDAMVYAIFSTYLAKRNRKAEAVENAEQAVAISPDSKNVNYNVAIAYLEVKEYKKAAEHAKRAEELGHPLPGVKNRLKQLGAWKE